MSFEHVADRIMSEIDIKHHDIVEAKMYILSRRMIDINSNALLQEYVGFQDSKLPERITYNDDNELKSQVKLCSQYFNKSIAFSEALLSLIHNGIYFSTTSRVVTPRCEIPVTSRGTSSGITLNQLTIQLPSVVKLSFSLQKQEEIFDEDVFLRNLDIPRAHQEVQAAIKDSIRCFKAELYQPAVVILGKAVEGAWIELGLALFEYQDKEEEKKKKDIDYIKGMESISRKMNKIVKSYSDKTLFASLHHVSEINHVMLEGTYNWSELIRESRNAIHFGVEPEIPNTYDKVSILLLSAHKHIKLLYKLISATSVTAVR